ncbi:MAG: DUF3891 family protein [Candidatus Sumerlaeaceae bacterium]|nr:DUF3891 family protein [Candidatus Sumerlaeaceae bacterium]
MIRRRWGNGKWMLVPQAEHARLAGVIAAAWRYSPVRPSGEIIKAIAHHDDGWADCDATPRLNERGEPRSFQEMPRAEHYAIWARSISLLAENGLLYGASVVAQYFINRARNENNIAKLSPRDAIALGNFLAEQEHRMALWRKKLEKQAAEQQETVPNNPNDSTSAALVSIPVGGTFEDDVRLLEVCDKISILLCGEFTGKTTIDGVPYLQGVDQLTIQRPNGKFGLMIEPLPFRKNLRDHVRAVLIPIAAYASDEELQQTVRSSAPVSQEFLISAPSEDTTVA